MFILIKFLIVTQILSKIEVTNYSKINIRAPIDIFKTKPILTVDQKNKFNRVKKLIITEMKNKIIDESYETYREIYNKDDEFWILYESAYIKNPQLFIFDVSGKYLDVYEYVLSYNQLNKLMKNKLQNKINYFIEYE